MNGITELLRHLGISRSVIRAIFLTSSVFYFGPRFSQSYFEILPKGWTSLVLAVLIFSACILFFWGFSEAWNYIARCWTESTIIVTLGLNQSERDILAAMGEHPNESLNLDRLNYENSPFSRLELIEQIRGLAQKNLVIFPSQSFAFLTTTGQQALKIQRARTKNII